MVEILQEAESLAESQRRRQELEQVKDRWHRMGPAAAAEPSPAAAVKAEEASTSKSLEKSAAAADDDDEEDRAVHLPSPLFCCAF